MKGSRGAYKRQIAPAWCSRLLINAYLLSVSSSTWGDDGKTGQAPEFLCCLYCSQGKTVKKYTKNQFGNFR